MNRLKLAVVAILLFCGSNLFAGIRPSFSLEYSSWEATDIVIASEGAIIDGNLVILEALKGGLLPKEVIFVPELAKFRSLVSRLVKVPFGMTRGETPQYVSGRRMILFLKKSPATQTRRFQADPKGRMWEPASLEKEMNVSVIWLEGDRSFAFIQWMNPGPSELIEYGKSETQLKERAREVIQERSALDRAAAIAEKSARAEAIAPFTASSLFLARQMAFEELEKGGEASIAVLYRILENDANLNVHDDAIRTLVAVGGEKAGPVLIDILRAEMVFWRATAPRLQKGWWNAGNDIDPLHHRYQKVAAILRTFRTIRISGSREVVSDFRDLWRTLPPLDDSNEPDQLTKTSEEVLEKLPSQ